MHFIDNCKKTQDIITHSVLIVFSFPSTSPLFTISVIGIWIIVVIVVIIYNFTYYYVFAAPIISVRASMCGFLHERDCRQQHGHYNWY